MFVELEVVPIPTFPVPDPILPVTPVKEIKSVFLPVTYIVHVPDSVGLIFVYKKLLSSVFSVVVLYGNLFVLKLLK